MNANKSMQDNSRYAHSYHSSSPYDESHEQLKEREFFEQAHSIPIHPSEATHLLHDTLHVTQGHQGSKHHYSHDATEHNLNKSMKHQIDHSDVVYPEEDNDFARYSIDHHMPGDPERIIDPHDKMYDKHYETFYHDQTPTIP